MPFILTTKSTISKVAINYVRNRANFSIAIEWNSALRKRHSISANFAPISANRRATSSHFRYWNVAANVLAVGLRVRGIPMHMQCGGRLVPLSRMFSVPPSPPVAMARCIGVAGRSVAMLALHQRLHQPWTCCCCWLARLERLPTRSSYERRGPYPLLFLPLFSLYIGTLLQWRLINPLTQCCSFFFDRWNAFEIGKNNYCTFLLPLALFLQKYHILIDLKLNQSLFLQSTFLFSGKNYLLFILILFFLKM